MPPVPSPIHERCTMHPINLHHISSYPGHACSDRNKNIYAIIDISEAVRPDMYPFSFLIDDVG